MFIMLSCYIILIYLIFLSYIIKKAGYNVLIAFIPFYNLYIFGKIAINNGWPLLILAIFNFLLLSNNLYESYSLLVNILFIITFLVCCIDIKRYVLMIFAVFTNLFIIVAYDTKEYRYDYYDPDPALNFMTFITKIISSYMPILSFNL